jgi:hypothetical protein
MFEDALRKLRDLQRRAERLDGQQVPLAELFSDEFMLRNTEFSSIDELFEASGYKVETEEDFACIPDDEWDVFISERTRFVSWDEMKDAAALEWAKRRLELE